MYGGSGGYSSNGHLFRFAAADPWTRTDLGVPLEGSLEAGNLVVLNGKVYGATGDQYTIFSYDPAPDKLTVEGQVQGAMEIASMTAGPDGKLYGGDFPGGQFWVFDPTTGQGVALGVPVLQETAIRAVVAGPDGDIYGGTSSLRGQMFRYDIEGQAFEVLGAPVWRDSTVLSLILGSEGQIYGGTAYRRGRVFRFDPVNGGYASEGTATSMSISPRMRDQTYTPATSELWALALGSDGMLYASGYAAVGLAKLYRWDPAAGGLMEAVGTVPGDDPYVVYDLLAGPDGQIYGGAGGWSGPILFRYDPGSETLEEVPLDLSSEWHVAALALCPNGLIYGATAGDSGELFSYNPSTGSLAYHGQAVSGETAIESLSCGADNSVYGGTSPTGHLFKFGFSTGFTDLGQPIPGEASVSAVLCASDGMVYGGTTEQGRFFRYDPASHEVTDLGQPYAYDTEIWNLAAGPDGLLYGVTSGLEGHLFSFDTGSDELADLGRVYVYDRFVFGLAVDAAGQTIYLGTGWNYGELVTYELDYRFGWLELGYSTAIPEGTSLQVDILSAGGEPLLLGVPSGGSLLPISSATTPAIQLRAVLSTADPGTTPELLDWTVHWTEEPVMEIAPGELSFSAIIGGPDPSPQFLLLTNPSGGELTWTLEGLPEWLEVTPVSGTAPSAVSVAAHTSGLPGGTYATTLVFEGGETCVNCPVEVPVSLTIGWRIYLPLIEYDR